MTSVGSDVLGSPLYEAYASRHLGPGGYEAATFVYRREICPLVPTAAGLIADLERGCGELVLFRQADGFDAEGIAGATVTDAQRGHIVTRHLMFPARQAAVVPGPAGS